jgi:uncharacterized membrane protein
MPIDQWMSGADYNASGASAGGGGAGVANAAMTVATGAAIIFGQVGANKYVLPSHFKPEDVVIPEQLRDNRAYITAGVAAVLLIGVAILIITLK